MEYNNTGFYPMAPRYMRPPQPQQILAPPAEYAIMVSNCPIGILEAELRRIFSVYDPTSITIRKWETRGEATAKVSFPSEEKAREALKNKNFTMLERKELCMCKFDRKFLQQQDKSCNLFVKNLPDNITHRKLYELFGSFGEIFSVKIARNISDKPKGYGFVCFREAEAAAKAMSNINGKILEDRTLKVETYKKRERNTALIYNNIYVKNLPARINNEAEIRKLFTEFGEISSATVKEHELNEKKGLFGFVCFKDPKNAVEAVSKMNGKEIEGCKLLVTRALNKDQREREKIQAAEAKKAESRKKTLHVSAKDGTLLTMEVIRGEIGKFGQIKSISFPKRGADSAECGPIAYVVFNSADEAKMVVENYHGPKLAPAILESKADRSEKISKMHQSPVMFPPMMQPPIMGRGHPLGIYPPRAGRGGGRMPGRPRYPRGGLRGAPRSMSRGPMNYHMPPSMAPMGQMPPYAQMRPMPQIQVMPPGQVPPYIMAGGMPPLMNMPMSVPGLPPGAVQIQVPVQPIPPAVSESAQMTDEERDSYGESLYGKIERIATNSSQAAKITGMLLELPRRELDLLLSNEGNLSNKVREAEELLRRGPEEAAPSAEDDSREHGPDSKPTG